MKRIDIMKRAGRNLRQAKGRTFLTALAIAVGAFTLTLSLAAGEGARQYVDKLLKNNIDPKALFIVADKKITSTSQSAGLTEYDANQSSVSSASGRGASVKMLTTNDMQKLQQRSDVDQVVPIYRLSAKYVQFETINKKYNTSLSYYDATVLADTVAGSLPALGTQIGDGEVIVPQDYADSLKVAPKDLVGKKVTVTVQQAVNNPSQEQVAAAFAEGGSAAVQALMQPKTEDYIYTVRAITKKSAMALSSSAQLLVSTNAAKTLNEYTTAGTENAGKFLGATAIANAGHDPAAVKQSIEKDYGFSVQTAKDAQGLLFTFVNILQGIVAGFAFLALIASIFGIINTQYISVLERTSQIGLMKALGMSRGGIAKLFRYEAAWIGFLGGALGVALALVVGYVANPVITKALSLGENTLLIFVWWQIAILIISLVVVAIIAGWLPARKAARLDPIEALRTE